MNSYKLVHHSGRWSNNSSNNKMSTYITCSFHHHGRLRQLNENIKWTVKMKDSLSHVYSTETTYNKNILWQMQIIIFNVCSVRIVKHLYNQPCAYYTHTKPPYKGKTIKSNRPIYTFTCPHCAGYVWIMAYEGVICLFCLLQFGRWIKSL